MIQTTWFHMVQHMCSPVCRRRMCPQMGEMFKHCQIWIRYMDVHCILLISSWIWNVLKLKVRGKNSIEWTDQYPPSWCRGFSPASAMNPTSTGHLSLPRAPTKLQPKSLILSQPQSREHFFWALPSPRPASGACKGSPERNTSHSSCSGGRDSQN